MSKSSQIYQESPFLEPRRPRRALFIGAASGLILAIFAVEYWISGAFIGALISDLLFVLPYGLRLSSSDTRDLFLSADLRKDRLLKRSLLVLFVGLVFLGLSMHDMNTAKSDTKTFQLLLYFFGVILCWLELQLAFATYYAKLFYRGNEHGGESIDQGPQELIFPGDDAPLFTDFVYVANAVALTFAMSDVNIESSRMRKTVMFQALASFLFYTLIFSVVANLMINS
ncbi:MULTISPECIES: DUF1345 domain-containing protein [unclassified Synechococcus]|uniref:DUF1345 domain-containing protein n=1 Tax=unclassified Synechococcus TaxID=2626047 RepID=UPI0020CF4C91|nr:MULTISPECIES: DUF1345 domain-containing protein [unclassified Synechococcus]MCP9940094.1 DUF1345 domain-containing protein [Synechococcus sp. Cruz CV12-2-Slac-r]